MKSKYPIIIISLAFGTLIWILDTILDTYVFHKGPILDMLIFNIPSHELYIRSVIMICFLVFGIICGTLFEKVKKNEMQKEEIIQELKEANRNIKTLKGLLPICASCKKIRDDNDKWHQMETYVVNNTEAKLSHGLCPDCYDNAIEEVHSMKSEDKINPDEETA